MVLLTASSTFQRITESKFLTPSNKDGYLNTGMSQRKQQKEIDKAIANLMKYGEQAPWSERKEQFFSEMLMGAADRVDVPVDEFGQALEDSGYMGMVFGYLFELFASSYWDNDDFCMIENYIKRRGWREAPRAKRYLQALAKSEVKLWEITSVSPGHWVEIRPVGSTVKTLRVYEHAGSQGLKRWDCIAARVILLDGKYGFGGGILPFSPDQAQEVPILLERARQNVIDTLKDVRAEDTQCQWSDEDVEEMAKAEANEQLPDLLFSFWACQTYLAITKPMPTLLNRDGHQLHWSKIKFPVNTNDTEEIERRLHAASELDFNHDSKEWIWLKCDKDNIENAGATVLGHLSITDQHLVATVNSIERAEEIKGFLSALLSELIGAPLSVHESFESMMEKYSTKGLPSVETIDAPELITAALDRHYQKILDEPIPALNNLTPRDCSQEKDQHAILIQWLKGLENNTAAVPHMCHYDFKWIWEELGLECIGVDE